MVVPNLPSLDPNLMHAPDGFFAVWLSLLGWAIMIAMVGLALRNTRAQLGERQIPLMGVVAATIFAGQMINFSIPGGTSGHLLGGALAAAFLGPWGGVLVMTAVVSIQALVFQDGGLLALGLNVINMGIITSFSGYFFYKAISNLIKGDRGVMIGGFVGGWLSVVLTSLFASVELAVSGTSPLQIALPAMVGVHVMIGIGEGLLTASALGFILISRRGLLTGAPAQGQRSAGLVLAGLAIALAITLFSPLASPYADGFEKVTSLLTAGTSTAAQPSPLQLLPDYTIPALGNSPVSTIVAGMVGVGLVFMLAYGAARLANRQSQIANRKDSST